MVQRMERDVRLGGGSRVGEVGYVLLSLFEGLSLLMNHRSGGCIVSSRVRK